MQAWVFQVLVFLFRLGQSILLLLQVGFGRSQTLLEVSHFLLGLGKHCLGLGQRTLGLLFFLSQPVGFLHCKVGFGLGLVKCLLRLNHLLAKVHGLLVEANPLFLQRLQLGKQSGFLLVGLLKWLGHAFQLLDHLLDLGKLAIQRFRLLFVLLDFLQNGSKSRLLLLGRFFQMGSFRQSRLLLLFRFRKRRGSFFQLLGPSLRQGLFVRNLLFQNNQAFFLLVHGLLCPVTFSQSLVHGFFLFRDWLGFGLLEGFLNGLLTIRNLLPFVLALL